VTLYNTSSNYPSNTGSYGGITLSGNGSFSLSAPTTGPYAGVVIFQAHANTRAVLLSGTAAAGLSGTVYAPAALLYVSGNASVQGALDVNELALSGNAASTQVANGGDVSGGGTAGQLLAGDLAVYVNDPGGLFTADELARIQDAVNAVDAVVAPYGVTVSETTDPSLANVVIDTGSTSAAGGYADGVLGCYTTAGEITLIQGWNWYAGADPTQIGAGQYDFKTTVTHELGHALGLGESSDPTSAMYGTLAPATTIRTLTTADLSIPYEEAGGDAQRAAPVTGGQEGAQTESPLPEVQANAARVVLAGPSGDLASRGAVGVIEVAGTGTDGNVHGAGMARSGLPATSVPDGQNVPTEAATVAVRSTPLPAAGGGTGRDDAGGLSDVPRPAATPADPPGACSNWRGQPSAVARDAFFQARQLGAGRASDGVAGAAVGVRNRGDGTDRGEGPGPTGANLAGSAPVLLALLGATWAAPAERLGSRKPWRQQPG
jgi:hypothetical protein